MSLPATFPAWVFDNSPIEDPLGHGQRAVDFLRVLKHPKSTAPGRQFQLADFQERIVRRIYGPRHTDGRRKVRTVFMLLPRGGRKTTLGAGLSLLHTIGPERTPGGLALNAASDREQARIAFEEAALICREDPRIADRVNIVDYRHRLEHPKSAAVLRAVSSDAGRQHGSTPVFALLDELHAWPKRDLFDVLRTGLVKTAGSLLVVITTAGKGQQNIAFDLYSYAVKVAKGEIEDDGFLPILFEAGPEEDWRDEAVWRRVNPGLDLGFPDIDGLRQLAREAEQRPADREAFRQLHLNVWLDHSAAPFVDAAVYDRGARPVDLEEMRDHPCWLAVDLSSVRDLTVVLACWRLDDDSLAVWPWFFCPAEALRQRSERDRVPYTTWAEAGHITPTAGDVVDYGAVEDCIRDLVDRFDVREIAFDPYLGQQMMAALGEDGLPVVAVRQGALTMGPAIRDLEHAIVGGRLAHGGHPILRWNFANVVVETDKAGLKAFNKGKARDRIDGAVACAMAVSRAMAGDSGRSVYDDVDARPDGILIL
ncbi:terminase TerL endonuclease subunit [Nitrospirillum amazonense]|uniref:terminase large subunit n=1 Tax=Nitrospirillum amazonense TaxID=28077 RepID=UPI002DD41D1F|nr:terminase TerL endonuclease subunit [Nitrospirillum amazonense]MEC4590564.1 terminase TerL endonuclease subunit [Nitrospirillum amazonense]